MLQKKGLGSHQLPCLIFTTNKELHSSSNTQSWETHHMHSFFWWYSIFLMRTKRFIFQFTNKNKKLLALVIFKFVLMRTKTFIFLGLTFFHTSICNFHKLKTMYSMELAPRQMKHKCILFYHRWVILHESVYHEFNFIDPLTGTNMVDFKVHYRSLR